MNENEEEQKIDEKSKIKDLEEFREYPEGKGLTTDQGVKVNHTDDSLKAGEQGPTLMEDFHFREKITHFDHERIPERIVHARERVLTVTSNVMNPCLNLQWPNSWKNLAKKLPYL